MLDLALGSRRLLGALPGPDDLIGGINAFLRGRLDRDNRSNGERFIRGLIVLVALLPLLHLAGRFLDAFAFAGTAQSILLAVVLSLFIRQRQVWATMLASSKAYAGTTSDTQFENNRANIRKITFGFSDNFVSNLLIFTIGGFGLLLPYRLLRLALDTTEESYIQRPQSPYLSGFWPLAELAALPGTLLASLLIAMAHIFVPGTKMSAIIGMAQKVPQTLFSRLLPLNILAHGLGLSFHTAPGKKAAWIGPKSGRAKQTAMDVRKTALILVVALLLGILVGFLVLGFLLSPQ
ncbi:MAG: hypothetical protein HWE08_11150 [Alphaproteobacteria bacterium]|nr:hypothetical protein [Alphaproteobacteria bacterium]